MSSDEVDILLVDDSQDDLDLTLHALRSENLANRFFIAYDGEEALDFLFCSGPHKLRSFDHPPKIILLDLKLPKVDGLEVLDRIKRDPRTATIPVVLMTSSKEERDRVNRLQVGREQLRAEAGRLRRVPQACKVARALLAGRQPASGYPCIVNACGASAMSSPGIALATRNGATAKTALRALLVEDNQLDAALVLRALWQGGFEVNSRVVQDEATFTDALRIHKPEIVLADYNLPSWKGMEAVNVLRREGLDIPMILVSGALGDMTAVECIKRGATDYVLKDGLARLPESVRRALEEKHLRELRRQSGEELAQKVEELARSNSELEQFAYIASHDLQEPLRMVTAYTQLLGERYRGKLDADADKFIGYASEGAQRMQILIQDLLAFSRVGHSSAASVEVDCNEVMRQVLQTLSAAIEEAGATVTCGELPIVWADQTQITQVFQNLVGNALKFRQNKAPTISIQAEKSDSNWKFSVSDTGIGIPPESIEGIFVVFKRLHARTEYAGNGIGLAICKKIVERYGGKIWVESQLGSGSTFRFTMPFHTEEREGGECELKASAACGG